MSDVSVRDLRNRGADVLARVDSGETLTVTRDGKPVAALSPLPRPHAPIEVLIARRKALPRADAATWQADIDELLDPSL